MAIKISRPSFLHEDSRFYQYFSKLINSIDQGLNSIPAGPPGPPGPPGVEMPVLVYRPFGVANRNIFTNWADLVAFAGSTAGQKIVLIDPVGSPGFIDIPGGVWNLGGECLLTGPSDNSLSLFRPQDGCQFVGVTGLAHMWMESQNNSPTVVMNGQDRLYLYDGAQLSGTGNAPTVEVVPGANCQIIMLQRSVFNWASALGQVYSAAGANVSIEMYDNSYIDQTTLRWDGNLNVNIYSPAVRFDRNQISGILTPNYNFPTSTSGSTINRPTGVLTGSMYFDTDLGYSIWWNGGLWVDSSGTPV